MAKDPGGPIGIEFYVIGTGLIYWFNFQKCVKINRVNGHKMVKINDFDLKEMDNNGSYGEVVWRSK